MRTVPVMTAVFFATLLLVFADLADERVKRVIHAHSGFRRSLDEWDAVLFCHLSDRLKPPIKIISRKEINMLFNYLAS